MIQALLAFFAIGTFGQPSSPALDTARQAAMIQSGLQTYIDRAQSYTENKVKTEIRRVGVEKPVEVVGIAYKIYKDKAVNVREFNNPLIPGCRNHATITLNSVTVGFRWNF